MIETIDPFYGFGSKGSDPADQAWPGGEERSVDVVTLNLGPAGNAEDRPNISDGW